MPEGSNPTEEKRKNCLLINRQKPRPFCNSVHIKLSAEKDGTGTSDKNTQIMKMPPKSPASAKEVWYAHSCIWVLLFLPYSPRNSQLQLLPVSTGEEKCHVPLDNETVMAVPDLPVAISDASWGTLPYELPAICTNLQTVAVITGITFIAHKTEECHVHRSHAKLECFEVKAKVLAKTMENLTKDFTIMY